MMENYTRIAIWIDLQLNRWIGSRYHRTSRQHESYFDKEIKLEMEKLEIAPQGQYSI